MMVDMAWYEFSSFQGAIPDLMTAVLSALQADVLPEVSSSTVVLLPGFFPDFFSNELGPTR